MSRVSLNHRSSFDYEFDWGSSGSHTFIHNLTLPTKFNETASKIEIIVGDATVTSMATDSFVINAVGAGRGRFMPDVHVNDYGETV